MDGSIFLCFTNHNNATQETAIKNKDTIVHIPAKRDTAMRFPAGNAWVSKFSG